MQVTVLLPAYNEEHSIEAAVRSVASVLQGESYAFKVVVVDDGSTDRTRLILDGLSDELPVFALTHPANLGLGAAILTGFRHVLPSSAEEDVIVTMDADGTHDASLLPAMAKRLQAGDDVVIASRFQPGAGESGVPPFRRFLSRMASRVGRFLLRVPGVRDYSSGYRAYRAPALREAFKVYGDRLIQSRGFPVMVELITKLGRLGARVSEVPLVLRYDLKRGPSKMKLLPTLLAYGKVYGGGLMGLWPGRRRRPAREGRKD